MGRQVMARRPCNLPGCDLPADTNGMCLKDYKRWRRNGSPPTRPDAEPAPTNGAWVHKAACAGVDPELFWPSSEDGNAHRAQVQAAKAVCSQCPVTAACLAWALVVLPYGIAGGHTAGERAVMRRHQAVAAPAEVSA